MFRVTKGISTFDYCHLSNVLVTGGMDQAIRLWNPFVTTSPIGILYGHGSPIFNIKLDSGNERFYSISNDNTLKVMIEYILCILGCTNTSCTMLHVIRLISFFGAA